MKIAVLTNFRGLGVGLSYRNTTIKWQEELLLSGYDSTLFIREGSKVDPQLIKELNISATIPKVKTRKFTANQLKDDIFDRDIKVLVPFYEQIVREYTHIIAHDYTLLKMFVVFQSALRQALKNVYGENNPATPKILNIYHSNISESERPKDISDAFKYPERLRFVRFPNSRPVSLSHASVKVIANTLNLPYRAVGVLPNPAVSPSPAIIRAFGNRWMDSNVLQVMPICATRWESKGVKTLLKIFGSFKINGLKPFLMIVTQNGKGKEGRKYCEKMKEFGENGCRLVYGEDFLITSLEYEEWASGVPHEYVNELQSYADLFIFPSKCEMCPNILLEASRHGQYVVISENLPVARELCPSTVVHYNLPVTGGEQYGCGENNFYALLAKELYADFEMDRAVNQRRYARQFQNRHYLFKKYFEPLLHGEIPYSYPDLTSRTINALPDNKKYKTTE